MTRFHTIFVPVLFSIGLYACKTSGDLASGRGNRDERSSIKTVENPALSAESGAPKDVSERLNMAEGELETLKATHTSEQEQNRRKIEELEKQNQVLREELEKAKTPPPQPGAEAMAAGKSEAEALWEAALTQHKAGEHDKVTSTLETLLQNQSKLKNHLEVTLLLGLTQYKLQSYNDAAITFNQVIDKYPKRKEASLAWFGQGCAFMKLGQKDSAQLIFDELKKRYPKSPEALAARRISSKKDKTPADLFALTRHYPSLNGME